MTADNIGAECADPLAALIPACVLKPGSSYCRNVLDTCKHADNQVLSKCAVCVCVCVCVRIYIHTYTHTYIHTYIHACMHIYIYIYIYI